MTRECVCDGNGVMCYVCNVLLVSVWIFFYSLFCLLRRRRRFIVFWHPLYLQTANCMESVGELHTPHTHTYTQTTLCARRILIQFDMCRCWLWRCVCVPVQWTYFVYTTFASSMRFIFIQWVRGHYNIATNSHHNIVCSHHWFHICMRCRWEFFFGCYSISMEIIYSADIVILLHGLLLQFVTVNLTGRSARRVCVCIQTVEASETEKNEINKNVKKRNKRK